MPQPLTRADTGGPEHLERRLRELETLNAIGEVLNRAPFFREAVHEALERLVALTGSQAGWVFLARIEHGDVHYSSFRLAAVAGLPSGLTSADCAALRDGSCECQGMFRRFELDHGTNLVTCSRLASVTRDDGDTGGLRVHASVPLQGREGPVGILNLAAPDNHRFDPQTLSLLTAVGRQLGIAYERAQAQAQRRVEAEHVAALEERSRVARDIHDSATQLLFGAHLALRVAREGGDPARTADAVERGSGLVEAALDELRGLVELLRTADLDQGLYPALVRLRQRVSGPVEVHLDAEPVDLAPATADGLYRIVQEAVHNTLKHADATSVWIRLLAADERLVLTVSDDGRGLSPEPVRGVGLTSIAARVEELGGTLAFGEREGGGARVRVEVPA